MSPSMQMEIAGLLIRVLSEASVPQHESDPTYKLFSRKENKITEPYCTTIRIVVGSLPGILTGAKIFDSGQSWSMFRDVDGYCIAFHPPAFKQPLWIARTDADFTKVTVYCGEAFTNPDDGKTLMADPIRYPLDQILIIHILAQIGGALVHAAGIEIDGQSFIFPGKSGAGKSTLTSQLATRDHIGLLSDDRVVIRKIDGVLEAFGTPWPGDAEIAANSSAPLAGMFFIVHGSENTIQELGPQQALERLLPVVSVPWYDREVFPKILSFCDDLISRVPSYEFHFEPTPEGIDVFEEFVTRP